MKLRSLFTILLAVSLCSCAANKTEPLNATQQTASEFTFRYTTMIDTTNPLSAQSTLPYGLVDFSKLKSEHFKPALEAGMAQHIEEINQIANQSDAPTFENTMIPLEKSGQLLQRASNIFFNAASSDTDDVIAATENEIAPKFAAHEDAIHLNDKLFARIETLYNNRQNLGLDAESVRLIEQYYIEFVRAGAKLSPEQKAQITAINSEIATIETQFGQNILSEKNDSGVVVENVEELDGLTDEQIRSAKDAATAKGLDGKYLIVLQNTSIQPILKTMNNRALRERVHKASISRGMRSNAFDNTQNVLKLVELRAKRAKLLGYDSFASYFVADQMAATTANVNNMLNALVPAAKASLEREAAELQALIDAQNGGFKLEAWDWLYYAEQLRKQKYDFDDNELRPYFELDNVIKNGVFYAANILYGLTFKERPDLKSINPEARIFEVFDADGTPVALFVGDYFARDSKRGGAWMTEQAVQSKLLGTLPIIENQINITKPAAGEKALLTYDEVTTVFHEFGHALHGMLSNVKYPKFSGVRVPNDFVEFPSQFNESWATHPDVISHYALHYQTGEKIPQALLDKVKAAAKFNQGYMTTEYLSATILDQLWHQLSVEEIEALDKSDFQALEAKLLENVGLNLTIAPPRYRSTYFNHIFANGYSAGYYAYIWSEVLDADAEQWFKKNGMSRENGMQLRNKVLSRGYTEDPMKLYRDFTGHDPEIDPLLVRRGLK